MDKKALREIWDSRTETDVSEFRTDEKFLRDLQNDPTGFWQALFEFLDTDPKKPLTQHDLLRFWQGIPMSERVHFVREFSQAGTEDGNPDDTVLA